MKAIIRNIVFACPEESLRALAAFYGELLGMRVIREDWLVITRDGSSLPRIAFGDGAADSYEPPRWPHTDFPQQAHLDITVHDLEAAEESVRRLGATQLQDRGDYRSFADPVGHPFCLYRDVARGRGEAGSGLSGRLARIVFDCPAPKELATFYGELLGMPETELDSPDRVVIAGEIGDSPMLAFQRAPTYKAPRWPDPAFPQHLHLDLQVEDAAHPFCLCAPDQ